MRRPKLADIPDRLALECSRRFHAGEGPAPYLALAEALGPGFPPKLIAAKFDRLARRGLIDYGVSARTGWPTDAGLAYLQDHGGSA